MNNKIQANDIIFTVYTWNNSGINEKLYINNEDLNSVKESWEYIESDVATISFKDFETYNKIVTLLDDSTLILERNIYPKKDMNNDLTATANYNPLFFINKRSFSENDVFENSYLITALDWKGFIENHRFLTHNVFYNPDTIPVDPDSGEMKFPDDFNKIKYYGTPMDKQLKNFYKNDIINPYDFAKGIEPKRTNERKIAHYNETDLTVNVSMFNYDTLQERKTLLEYKRKYYNTILNNRLYRVARVDCKVIDQNGNFSIAPVYNPQNNHIIDYNFSLDKIKSLSYDIDKTDYSNAVYIESDSDDFDFKTKVKKRSSDITTFEFADKSQNDDGDTTSIQSYANEKFYEHRELITRTIEIFFNKKEYLKDIKIGDIIELKNFVDVVNGKYIITKLSEVIENNEKRYSIDEMEYVE